MMQKIGILTQYYHSQNIGGLLQAYALPIVLENHGYIAQQISFDFKRKDTDFIQKYNQLFACKVTIKKLFKYPFSRAVRIWKNWQNKKIIRQVNVQNAILRKFEQFIAHSTEKYNNANIEQANKNYDTFITGSDQVFASYLLPLSAYYGEFTSPNTKVISYAASSNMKQFPKNVEKLFIQKLQRLDSISVREKTLKDYIERITDKKATVVLDPTFLLSPQEWLKIANPAPVPQKPYIFCYFLGGASWQRKLAQAYADKYGYEVVHLPYIMQSVRPADRFLKGQGRYDVGPREFISLINGAQCVFTDSFHGLAFSINFGKNFYVFNRDDASGPNSMNARITDALSMLRLTKRHITYRNAVLDNTPLDFTYAHQILAHRKKESINWLLDALNI